MLLYSCLLVVLISECSGMGLIHVAGISIDHAACVELRPIKESQFLAPILLESPLMFESLEKSRDKYSIDKLVPNKDPYKQRV
jgi:hypothetical protein